jgi:hypothetical protein
MRDDSFEMSVDHDPIDIVWRSTQVPAMQSLLEESKSESFKLGLWISTGNSEAFTSHSFTSQHPFSFGQRR